MSMFFRCMMLQMICQILGCFWNIPDLCLSVVCGPKFIFRFGKVCTQMFNGVSTSLTDLGVYTNCRFASMFVLVWHGVYEWIQVKLRCNVVCLHSSPMKECLVPT